jgi:hypothetical protein
VRYSDLIPGTRVEILHPRYAAGRTGVVLAPEALVGRQVSDRWIVQVEAADDLVLSLKATEFRILA